MFERLRFLVRKESDLVFTVEATSDYWWELAWELADRGCNMSSWMYIVRLRGAEGASAGAKAILVR